MRKIRRTICLLTAMLCALGLYSVRADAVELPITSRAALLMENLQGRCCSRRTSTSSWSPPASPRS